MDRERGEEETGSMAREEGREGEAGGRTAIEEHLGTVIDSGKTVVKK